MSAGMRVEAALHAEEALGAQVSQHTATRALVEVDDTAAAMAVFLAAVFQRHWRTKLPTFRSRLSLRALLFCLNNWSRHFRPFVT